MWSYSRPPRQELDSKCQLSKFALDFTAGFQTRGERARKYWLDAGVGRRVIWSVCYCWERGLTALRASQLPLRTEILLPKKQTEKLEEQNKCHSVLNPLPSLEAEQKADLGIWWLPLYSALLSQSFPSQIFNYKMKEKITFSYLTECLARTIHWVVWAS